jgi:hypothetical protein
MFCDNESNNKLTDEFEIELTDENECEIVETCIQLMTDYINEFPRAISDTNFHEQMIDEIKILFIETFVEKKNCIKKYYDGYDDDDLGENIIELIELASEIFYTQIIPKRSYSTTFTRPIKLHNIKIIQDKINCLNSIIQPEQRTLEWYIFRYGLLTASNSYKAYESQALQNSLIYEKCKPFNPQEKQNQNRCVNVDSSLHWGQKYEPLSVLLYEKQYNTKLGEYGCIRHSKYSFIGASPDGININQINSIGEKNERFGRMLEIKNVVSREIDSNPEKAYWIQMQLQMETCDLDECDFLETKFVEYPSEKEYIEDIEPDIDTISILNNELTKSIIMYFSKDGKPIYIHKPIEMTLEIFDLWSQYKIHEQSLLGISWIKNIYWKIEEFSCVLVLRNRIWFKDNVGKLQEIWEIIEKERITGYEHRAPKKRTINKIDEKDNDEQLNKTDNFINMGKSLFKKFNENTLCNEKN